LRYCHTITKARTSSELFLEVKERLADKDCKAGKMKNGRVELERITIKLAV
jgi:hypothetical protein